MQREATISSERLPRLRLAIQTCRLSFPAQVPEFSRQYRPDAQWRIATLYFVRGWSCGQLAQRYGVTCSRIRQALRNWVERAATMGYLQRIPPEARTGTVLERATTTASAIHADSPPLWPTAIVQPFPLQVKSTGRPMIHGSGD